MRIGNITSSEIVALTTNGTKKDTIGKPFYTYVQQCIFERRLGKSLDSDAHTKELTWGNLMEMYFFYEKGQIKYTPMMNETIKHNEYDFWVGSPDAVNNEINAVVELKCPYTLNSFCQLVEPILQGYNGITAMQYIRKNHKQGEKYYWQCISNAILTGKNKVEFLVYCPFQSCLEEIRQLANNAPAEQLSWYYWIAYASDKELPHLIEDAEYSDVYSIVFDAPYEDVEFLTSRVAIAGNLINNRTIIN